MPTLKDPIKVFISYAPADEEYFRALEKHLVPMRQEGLIETWHVRKVGRRQDWSGKIDAELEAARVILLLVSPDFLSSGFCFGAEMNWAMAQYVSKGVLMFPILLRSCNWTVAPFGAVPIFPSTRTPLDTTANRDAALAEVAVAIRSVLKTQGGRPSAHTGKAEPVVERSSYRVNASGSIVGATAAGPGASATGTVHIEHHIGQIHIHTQQLHLADNGTAASKSPHSVSSQIRDVDEQTRRLSKELDAAQERRRTLLEVGTDTTQADAHIADLKRRMREGGRLRPLDTLGDGRYLLVGQLGHGGFSVVWKARDRERRQEVAIKVLHPSISGDQIKLDRFFRGARKMLELNHDAVVRVLKPRGEDGGFYYYVMEYLGGGDFRDAVIKGRISGEVALSIVLRVGQALSCAHERGLVHRDVKPANIVLDTKGNPKLTDFDLVGDKGTVGGTRTGPMGTFIYAAPEVMSRPQEADSRADVYGLGMTAIFGLYGADLPAQAFRDAQSFLKEINCRKPLRDVLVRAVSWDPSARFESAREFCEALGEATAPEDHADVDPAERRLALWLIALAALVTIAFAAGLAYKLHQRGVDDHATTPSASPNGKDRRAKE